MFYDSCKFGVGVGVELELELELKLKALSACPSCDKMQSSSSAVVCRLPWRNSIMWKLLARAVTLASVRISMRKHYLFL